MRRRWLLPVSGQTQDAAEGFVVRFDRRANVPRRGCFRAGLLVDQNDPTIPSAATGLK